MDVKSLFAGSANWSSGGIRYMKASRLYSIGWLAMLVVALTVACKPVDKIPLSGNITLEYVSISRAGDDVAFTLANGTSRSVYFRGDPEPLNVYMTCSTANYSTAFGHGLYDPPPDESDIKVA